MRPNCCGDSVGRQTKHKLSLSLHFHWHVWQLLQELASKQHISVSGKTLKFCMFVVFFVRQQNIFHTSHFLAAVSSCKGSSNLIQFNYAIKDCHHPSVQLRLERWLFFFQLLSFSLFLCCLSLTQIICLSTSIPTNQR